MTDFTFAHREEGFDNHIDMSIRHYSSLVDDIVSMSDYFVEEGTEVEVKSELNHYKTL